MDRRRTIMRTISRSVFAFLIAVIIGVGHASLANAQFGGIVYDPANYRQNFMTAVRSYTQIVRQGQQLRNEANMLINQAKHLSKLDLNSVNDLNRILSEIAYLNTQADNVAYEVGRTRQLVKEYFPESYEDFSVDELVVQAEQQWQMSQRAYNDAMVMQSKMVESLETDRAHLGQIMNKSHASVGELQATQSTNQLLGLLIKQSMQAQQMQITQARAGSIDAARRIATEEESRILHQRFVGSNSAYTRGTR